MGYTDPADVISQAQERLSNIVNPNTQLAHSEIPGVEYTLPEAWVERTRRLTPSFRKLQR